MNCSNCGNPIRSGAGFCGQCGAPVAQGGSAEGTRPLRTTPTSAFTAKRDFQHTRTMAGASSHTNGSGSGLGGRSFGGRGGRRSYQTDIAFVVDGTASMGPVIQGVVNTILGFTNDLDANGIDAQLALIEYRDLKCREPTKVHGIARTTEEFRRWVSSIKPSGGGDAPESAIDAAFTAIEELTFRPDAVVILVLVSDAPYHEPDQRGRTMAMLIDEVIKRKIVAYVIGPDISGYRRLADCMKGILFNIAKHPEDFRGIIGSLRASITATVPRMAPSRTAVDPSLGRTRLR